jgi:hypothetical protein
VNNHKSKTNPTLLDILRESNLNLSNNPRGTDKGDYKSYVTNFYEAEFSARRLNKNRLLEVGVRSGASLALWAKYFENIEIIGLDVEKVGSSVGPVKKYLDFPFVQFFCNNAYNQETADKFQGEFTILIDDGPHSLASQIKFLELYLPKLAQDGVLVIEDILRGYRDCYFLMKSLPKGNKYNFELYNFNGIKKDGGFLFVVRHNSSGGKQLWLKYNLTLKYILEMFKVLYRRVLRGDFSLKDRREI